MRALSQLTQVNLTIIILSKVESNLSRFGDGDGDSGCSSLPFHGQGMEGVSQVGEYYNCPHTFTSLAKSSNTWQKNKHFTHSQIDHVHGDDGPSSLSLARMLLHYIYTYLVHLFW